MEIFPKRLTHGFDPKYAIFPTFFFGQYSPGKCILRYSRTKKRLSRHKNKKFKKSKNGYFSQGVNPSFWCKSGHFSNFFFQGIQPRKMCFTIFKNKKPTFQALKTRSSKCRKIEIFPKGLTHGFGPKMAIFGTFFFRQYSPGKCVLRSSRTKKGLSRL